MFFFRLFYKSMMISRGYEWNLNFVDFFSLNQNPAEILWEMEKCQIYPWLKLKHFWKFLTFFVLSIEGEPNPYPINVILSRLKVNPYPLHVWSKIWIEMTALNFFEGSRQSRMFIYGMGALLGSRLRDNRDKGQWIRDLALL